MPSSAILTEAISVCSGSFEHQMWALDFFRDFYFNEIAQ